MPHPIQPYIAVKQDYKTTNFSHTIDQLQAFADAYAALAQFRTLPVKIKMQSAVCPETLESHQSATPLLSVRHKFIYFVAKSLVFNAPRSDVGSPVRFSSQRYFIITCICFVRVTANRTVILALGCWITALLHMCADGRRRRWLRNVRSADPHGHDTCIRTNSPRRADGAKEKEAVTRIL
jgi:hypothetical protein